RRWAASFTWPESADRLAGLIAAEYDARRAGKLRRRRSDLVMLSEFTVADPDSFLDLARARLRNTDRFGVDDGRAWILAYGSDDRHLDSVVSGLGGIDAVHRVAVGADLLRGVPDLDLTRHEPIGLVTSLPQPRQAAEEQTDETVSADGDAVA